MSVAVPIRAGSSAAAHSPPASAPAALPRDAPPRLHVNLPPRHPRSGSSRALLTPGGSSLESSPPAGSSDTWPHPRGGAENGADSAHTNHAGQNGTSNDAVAPDDIAASDDPASLDFVSYGKDLRRVFSFAVPASAINLVNFLVQFTSVLFVGRLGADYLGAAALANMLSNLTGYSVGFGATTALDALCSQAYGARSFKLVGRHTQRAMLILSLATIPVAFIWWQTGTILGWMGVEARICDLADDYTRILIGGMWPTFMCEVLRRYLQSQNILWPIVMSAVVTACSSALFNYVMFVALHASFAGPAIATVLAQWMQLISLSLGIVAQRWLKRYRRKIGSTDGRARRMGGETYASLPVPSSSGAEARSSNNQSPRTSATEDDALVVCMSPPPALTPGSPGWGAPSPPASPTVEMTVLKHRGGQHQQQQEQQPPSTPPRAPSVSLTPSTPSDADKLLPSGTASSDAPPPSAVSPTAAGAEDEDPMETWPSIWSREVLVGHGEFLKLAIPGALSLMAEWGSYEVSASMAARLGDTNLATHAIFMQTASLFYTTPLGIATACSISVGQFLGAGRGDRARQFAWMGLGLNCAVSIAESLSLILLLRGVWGSMFTDDAPVLAAVHSYLPVMLVYLFVDHLKCACMAVLRGCGRAPITVWGNILSCWIVGAPLAYVLVFRPYQFGLWGLWLGMSAAWLTACGIYSTVILRTDWGKEVEDARQRTERSKAAALTPQEAEDAAQDGGQSAAEGTLTLEEGSDIIDPPSSQLGSSSRTSKPIILPRVNPAALAAVAEQRATVVGTDTLHPAPSFTIRHSDEDDDDDEEEFTFDDDSAEFDVTMSALDSDASHAHSHSHTIVGTDIASHVFKQTKLTTFPTAAAGAGN